MPNTILVTGGTGYIGSHSCVCLLAAGFDVVMLDNFSNSHPQAATRVEQIAGRPVTLVQGDVRDRALLEQVFLEHKIDAVMHFAGLKAVGESCLKPLLYHDNNVAGTIALLNSMQAASVTRLIFSSSATVYGAPQQMPVTEMAALHACNPYGSSKLAVENMLRELCRAGVETVWQVALLRYFNPAGAHESGLMGENPHGTPNNLPPFIAQVAAGKRESLPVFGNDYATHDGTGVRDYIHVMDLARGHVLALEKLLSLPPTPFCRPYNLGTGQGCSVLEMIKTFERVNGVTVPYHIAARRAGDVAACWADPTRAQVELGWHAEKTLHNMLADSWRWQCANPEGYGAP